MHAFVASLLPSVAAQTQRWRWPLPDWQGLLAQDLETLRTEARPAEPAVQRSEAGALGALYVMEGSSLGARSLRRDAAALGFDACNAARFLHAHADIEAGQRWPRFLAFLEERGRQADRAAAATAALDTFSLAERCFRRALGTPA